MASQADTIREFLVELGFVVDQASERRFSRSIENATATVGRLGVALVGMASVAFAALTKVADNYERLYYLSQRTHSAAANIIALGNAFGQVGLSADDAKSAIANLAMAIRLNPGVEGLLNALGISTRGADGQARDATRVTTDLLQKLSKMPPYLAAQYGQMFGISPATLLQLLQNLPDVLKQQARWEDLIRRLNVDVDEAARRGKEWNNTVRDIGNVFELMAIKVSSSLMKELQPSLDGFRDFMIAHFDDIVKAVDNFVKYFLVGIHSIVDGIGAVLDWMDTHFTETEKTVLKVVAAILLIGAAATVAPILTITAAIVALVTALGYLVTKWSDVKAAMKPFFDELERRLHAIDAWIKDSWIGKFLQWAASGIQPGANNPAQEQTGRDQLNGDFRGLHPQSFQPGQANPNVIPINLSDGGGSGVPFGQGGGPNLPRGLRNNNPGNLRRWAGAGSDGGFAVFPTATAGLSAMRDNLLGYARRGIRTLAQIISTWAPSSENNTGAYVARIAKMLGVDPNQDLNLDRDPAMLSRLMGAMINHENGYNPFSQDSLNDVTGAPRLGSGGGSATPHVNVNQTNTIQVNGAGDPGAVAREVTLRTARLQADAVRNALGSWVA